MSKFIIYIIFSQVMRMWLEKERAVTFEQFMKQIETPKQMRS